MCFLLVLIGYKNNSNRKRTRRSPHNFHPHLILLINSAYIAFYHFNNHHTKNPSHSLMTHLFLFWRMERSKPWWLNLFVAALLCLSVQLSASLNDEGRALWRFREKVEVDPYGALSNWVEEAVDSCSWFGVECSDDGRVVALKLKDLFLEGTLTPELGKLMHLKSLVLHNNSFCGSIPEEIGELQKLEILDLGNNNLSGPIPSDINSILSLQILDLRHNRLVVNMPPELHRLNMLSMLLVDKEKSSSNMVVVTRNTENATIRKLLRDASQQHGHRTHNALAPSPSSSPSSSAFPKSLVSKSPTSSSSSSSKPLTPFPTPPSVAQPPHHKHSQSSENPSSKVVKTSHGQHRSHWIIFALVSVGFCCLVALSIIYFLSCRANKVVTVMPWRTGLSGQLQKAFVTGVPSLRRSELESACEDFSNVLGSLPDCFFYKGTLSSGVEIAVTSTVVTSAKDWSDQYETQYRKKISLLSKVNHKNFMNLIGYCEEEQPFTRMMVYEYAPNGTLFEHLHIKEADHLDWAARLRIIMGISYCLDHLHQLDPPVVLKNLQSSSIYLCDDYAAKISDLSFWNEEKEPDASFESSGVMDTQFSNKEGNVYKFGIILLETISGRLPFSEDDGLLVLWASSHLNGKRPLMDMIDPTLETCNEDDVIALSEVIKSCINPNPTRRPAMSDVAAQLRKITKIAPASATPKLSPLWWAELEIISTEGNSL